MSMPYTNTNLKAVMMLHSVVSFTFMMLSVLVSMMFLTLMERKILGSLQNRMGPSHTGFLGLLQPIADALKLSSKTNIFLSFSASYLYNFCPILAISLAIMLWITLPNLFGLFNLHLTMILVLLITMLNVYYHLIGGWASYSKYAYMASFRAVAQSVSYELSFMLVIFTLCFFTQNMTMTHVEKTMSLNTIFFSFISWIWFIVILAEMNRTPFDFSESESELVSGFNTEYSASLFMLYFMSEYIAILFHSILFTLMFFNSTSFMNTVMSSLICYTMIVVRGTYPRMRYDNLMMFCWKTILPIALMTLMHSYMVMLQSIN